MFCPGAHAPGFIPSSASRTPPKRMKELEPTYLLQLTLTATAKRMSRSFVHQTASGTYSRAVSGFALKTLAATATCRCLLLTHRSLLASIRSTDSGWKLCESRSLAWVE
jgi:hypothetical protein